MKTRYKHADVIADILMWCSKVVVGTMAYAEVIHLGYRDWWAIVATLGTFAVLDRVDETYKMVRDINRQRLGE